ncbi:MAG: AsmA family protein [Candidatus Schekmanbacteria bacterium]|nr:MAG: AsmA family protein [Candidatus Schekmanbacteria bacterium]
MVSEYIGRDVEIGDISVGIFTGVDLKDVSIKENAEYGEGEFLRIDNVELSFSFLDLLQKKLNIKNIYFKSPLIRIIRDEKGVFNFSDLIEKGTTKEAAKEKRKEEKGKKQTASKKDTFAFNVKKIVIDGGTILFTDRNEGEESSYRLENIYISLKGELAKKAFDISVKSNLKISENEASSLPIDIKGSIDLINKGCNISFVSKDVNPYAVVNAINPQYSSFVETLKGSKTDFEITANSKDYEKNAAIKSEIFLKAFGEKVSIPVDLKLKTPFANPEIEAKVNIENLSIPFIEKVLPLSIKEEINLISLEDGKIGTSLFYEGTIDDFSLSSVIGDFRIKEFKAKFKDYGNIPLTMNADGKIENGEISIKLSPLKLGNSDFFVRGNTKIPKEDAPINVNVSSESKILDLDEVVKKFTSSEEEETLRKNREKAEKSSKLEKGEEKKSKLFKLILSAKAEKIKYSNLPVNSLFLNAQYMQDIIKIPNLTFNLGEGKFFLKSEAYLGKKSEKLSGMVDAQNISLKDLKPLLFSDFSGKIEGLVTTKADYSAFGLDAERIKKTLRSKGKVEVKNITVSGVEFLNKVANLLSADELKTVVFKDGETVFHIKNEEIEYGKLRLNGKDLKVASDGDIAFDGKIDGKAILKLSPELSKKISGGKALNNFIGNKKGWTEIPLKFSGTTNSPKISLEMKSVKKKAVEKGKELLRQELDKIFKKDSGRKKKGKSVGKKKKSKKEDAVRKGINKLKDIFSLPGN